MLLGRGGSGVSHHYRRCYSHCLSPSQGSKLLHLSSFVSKTRSSASFFIPHYPHHHQPLPFVHHTMVVSSPSSSSSSSRLRSKSPRDYPFLSHSFSQREDEEEPPSDGLSSIAGGIVALGKFDALHIGHRELAIQASKVGVPYLLSFVGMAEVLGWERRAPVVAKCDRNRVLHSWAPFCNNVVPAEFQIEFASVRHLTPREFVEKLSKELGVCGVVAGENYRFGYKAAGDALELVRLCEEYSLGAYIINSVMDKSQDSKNMNSSDIKERGQISSTRVRHALAVGDMKYVSELLGRKHRLMLMLNDQKGLDSTSNSRLRISAPKSCLLNLPPTDGFYENCSLLFGSGNLVGSCRVFIGGTHIHLEMDDVGLCDFKGSEDFHLLGIEFSDGVNNCT